MSMTTLNENDSEFDKLLKAIHDINNTDLFGKKVT